MKEMKRRQGFDGETGKNPVVMAGKKKKKTEGDHEKRGNSLLELARAFSKETRRLRAGSGKIAGVEVVIE
jgi:hypothetical protein